MGAGSGTGGNYNECNYNQPGAAISTCHHDTVACYPLVLQPNKDTINAKTFTHTVTYIDKPLQKYDFNGIKHDIT